MMKSFQIKENDSRQRLDRFVKKVAPLLPDGMIQKYIRLKRIKVNGKRAENKHMLSVGDLVELYINDEFFGDEATEKPLFLRVPTDICVVYEDENILLVDKRQGLVVHEDNEKEQDTLIHRILHYLYEKGEYDPRQEQSFIPALCNRIDRNTGGIVIAAKNAATLRVMNALIAARKIQKYYLCVVHGRLTPANGTLKHYLKKDEQNTLVKVYDAPVAGGKTALSRYRTLQSDDRYTLVEVELLTGRTHQIRAQMAHIGHPLLGDGKYGLAKNNKQSGLKFQALYSYKLIVDGGEDAQHLAYLNKRIFTVENVWFVEQFFGQTLDE